MLPPTALAMIIVLDPPPVGGVPNDDVCWGSLLIDDVLSMMGAVVVSGHGVN